MVLFSKYKNEPLIKAGKILLKYNILYFNKNNNIQILIFSYS